MTQEEKQLLLVDLCARLLYGVKCRQHKLDSQICTLCPQYLENFDAVEAFEPYLRPMSSMTEEERVKYNEFDFCDVSHFAQAREACGLIDWLNKKMFDYRGLIELGLALEAKEGMYSNN